MTESAHRWMMNAVGEPMTRTGFSPAAPGEGEVTVEIAGCGVCHTDLGYLYDGVRTNHQLPLTLGHEISGTVVAAGKGAEAWNAKSVIISAVIPCGECDLCARGKGTICRGQKMPGNDIHGGFASHITVPARGLCEVDTARLAARGMSLADVSVVADAVTTPYQAAMQADIGPGSLAVVIGVGGVGGYAAQVCAALGATVVAVDVDDAKLETIARYGASATFNACEVSGRDLKKAIGAFAKENGLRATEWFIFECSGSAAGQQTAFGLLVHGATLSVVGFTMDKLEMRLSNLMAFHARALGNWGCTPDLYPGALDLVLDGKVEVLAFVEQHPLEDINRIFDAAHAHQLTRRAILVP
ncbi:MAG: 6-hydroxycyclohex-1-ene-1-carbonyl-CoA dehydrogenase [Rhodospirillales bacterium]|nr:6-hydroxycyclohex-1-ene-1-carbonyl-CoA dehydrogenase [Rhodospirillales bacterium]MDH3790802.1 6-hydroxycyclohex-1-ene-1-carbonyl-CoA dehydrogenase [Rhodospirillales bacterium]MDH3909762.1 6-hydroxycyclohex-1-ene-1-carbonyl-CoA dehydrogenase [Rhodospirillales bacterium]MDH3919752.1 6-hydroxycyclohex-1-ene-1-carbonyl-CoA dehydrogenase [Rhodospirillales bacterium]MDH3967785.1 6-hydroxycyclohex-1-ene-1-carbonyl-CoA dehydrogenase [Rhodospirillales bacterium]